ncbi:MAG: type II toxin-antitoxin system HicA family toxin [Acidobacteria bacterium]|nr:MAG: type II toxin-antitoxin system HicA family toxin [Acidobacteriota bacterium]
MATWSPCKRRTFVRRLRRLGFEGPFPGSRHAMMVFGNRRMAIPSNREYSVPQLRMLLREVEAIIGSTISAADWSSL